MNENAQKLVKQINNDIAYLNDNNDRNGDCSVIAKTRDELIDDIKNTILSLTTNDEQGYIGIKLDPSEVEDYQELLDEINKSNNQLFFIVMITGSFEDEVCFDIIDLENAFDDFNISKDRFSEMIDIIKQDLKGTHYYNLFTLGYNI